MILCTVEETQKSIGFLAQFFDPTVIAAVIAASVAFISALINMRSLRKQRLESERNEIYKKLNDFYGPMRLHLKYSKELYDLFSESLIKRLGFTKDKFRTLPYLLDGKFFNKTEDALFKQIIQIGEKMEAIIGNNAGLIDDDNLHKEMIKLGTHIRVIRMAYNKEFLMGDEKEILIESLTFPNEITTAIDNTFFEFKNRLDELNNKKGIMKRISKFLCRE